MRQNGENAPFDRKPEGFEVFGEIGVVVNLAVPIPEPLEFLSAHRARRFCDDAVIREKAAKIFARIRLPRLRGRPVGDI